MFGLLYSFQNFSVPTVKSPLAHKCCDMQIRKRSPLSAAGADPGQHAWFTEDRMGWILALLASLT